MTTGYVPTRDAVIEVRRAAVALREIFAEYRVDSDLPGYPADIGADFALRGVFRLDVALNPQRLDRGDPARRRPDTRAWPPATVIGLHWLRDLLDGVMCRHDLGSMTTSASFEDWKRGRPEVPPGISVQVLELKALGRAIRRLGDVSGSKFDMDGDPRPGPESHDAIGHALPQPATQAVALFSPQLSPWVLGRPVAPLDRRTFGIIKALLEAGASGLSFEAIRSLDREGEGRLRRLAVDDAGNWGRVIRFESSPESRVILGTPEKAPEAIPTGRRPGGFSDSPERAETLAVDVASRTITIDGTSHRIKHPGAVGFFKKLVEAEGEAIPAKRVNARTDGKRLGRIFQDSLPPQVRSLIGSRRGKGGGYFVLPHSRPESAELIPNEVQF